jgi:hypothetical protein
MSTITQEIQYNGVTTTPDDYSCPDGDLRIGWNLTNDNGTLSPLLSPKIIARLPAGAKAVFLHTTSSGDNYVYCIGSAVYWTPKDSVSPNTTADGTLISSITDIVSFSAVGNTLIALGASAIYYLLWSDGAYTLLGDHLPEVSLSFGLQGTPRSWRLENDEGTFALNKLSNRSSWTDEDIEKASDTVMAKLNSFVAAQSTNKGCFVFPFFVRYALRLYDGSLACHSAPILMTPLTHGPMVVSLDDHYNDGSNTWTFNCDVILVSAMLDYMALSADEITELQRWKDIVQSVDVFISAPIYTYDQSGKCSGAVTNYYAAAGIGFDYNKFVGQLSPEVSKYVGNTKLYKGAVVGDVTLPVSCYAQYKFSDIYKMFFDKDRGLPDSYIKLPVKTFSSTTVDLGTTRGSNRGTTAVSTDVDQSYNTLSSTSNFYKLVSLKLDDLTTKRVNINVAEDYLQSLTSREAMTDEYQSHDKLSASMAYNFNQRLLLYGVKRTLYKGYNPMSMWPYVNAYVTYTQDDKKVVMTSSTTNGSIRCYVYIRENGSEYVVEGPVATFSQVWTDKNSTSWGTFLYYPNSNAYKMIVCRDPSTNHIYNPDTGKTTINITSVEYCEVALTPHDYLNGAYALLGFNTSRGKSATITLAAVDTAVVPVLNKVYQSEVNNPFYFPASGIVTVGTGNIISIAAAVLPISEGQFGQYPLYAFTEHGVWAVASSDTGTFSSSSPVTRDVVLSTDAICQLDQTIVFASARGIMELAGGATRCISDSLNIKDITEDTDDETLLSALPYIEQVLAKDGLTLEDMKQVPLRTYLDGCKLTYDYQDQRIIVFNPGYKYAYVYNLKTKTWSQAQCTLAGTLNAYPASYAIDTDNNIVDLSDSDDTESKVLLVTRPLKLEAPDVLKTLYACVQRGMYPRDAIASALYGSRDLLSWQLVDSSVGPQIRSFGGTPYKYFIVVVTGTLRAKYRLTGCTIVLRQRFTGRLH